MGMYDKPQYLTGKGEDAYVKEGDVFWLHNARIDGTTVMGGVERTVAKLKVSRTADGPTSIVYTSGLGITGQIKRMDDDDRARFQTGPQEVRLDAIPNKTPGNNPTHVITPADAPVAGSVEDEIPF